MSGLCHSELFYVYVKLTSEILLTVLERVCDHLPTQLRNNVKTHSASCYLTVFSGLVQNLSPRATLLNTFKYYFRISTFLLNIE